MEPEAAYCDRRLQATPIRHVVATSIDAIAAGSGTLMDAPFNIAGSGVLFARKASVLVRSAVMGPPTEPAWNMIVPIK